MSEEPKKYPSDLAERFQVRMPAGLRDRIAAAAELNNRSMNAEIVVTLEEKYPPPSPDKVFHSYLKELMRLQMKRENQERQSELSKLIIEHIVAHDPDSLISQKIKRKLQEELKTKPTPDKDKAD